jgi:MFS family permease
MVLSHQLTNIDENGKTVFKPSREFLLAFSALMTVCLAVAFDATTLSVGLPLISTDLGGTALEAFWSGISFLLASAVLQPTVAGLSHIFGRKYVSCEFRQSRWELRTNEGSPHS